MAVTIKWLFVTTLTFTANGIADSCLTFSKLSCTQGSKRGLMAQNSRETRLIPAMEFNCTGTLVGLTVSGRSGTGTMYPKLQIWRRSSTNANLYFKNGPEIQIDAHGSACETLTRNVNCNQEFHCRLSAANHVSVFAGLDIIGVELPPFNDQLFELLFVGNERLQHVWRREVTSFSLKYGTQDLTVEELLFLNVEVQQDPDECRTSVNDCDQICINSTGSLQCSCINGYTLSSDEKSCLDVDECTAGMHNCQQHCINANGGFLCGCNSSYQLDSDGTTCRSGSSDMPSTVSVILAVVVPVVCFLIGLLIIIIVVVVFVNCIDREAANHTSPAQRQTYYHRHKKVTNQRGTDGTLHCSDSSNETIQHGVVIKGSLKAKITSSLKISSKNLQISDPIGQGEFGIVYKGYLEVDRFIEIVAIKTLKGFIDKDRIQELLRESTKMKSFNHPNVMNLKGVCLDGGPVPYIILPYMANGSLLMYLKKKKSSLVVPPGTEIAQSQEIEKRLLDMCLQVAKGMKYLASKKVVHRDLAARNCMMDMNMVIKVADFGLSVNTKDKEYYRLASGDMGIKLPFRWMAPETFSDYIFSEKSDVWSFGVTCWEIFTGGQVPYDGIRPTSLKTELQGGKRLEKPNNTACSDEMYSIMQLCWKMDPNKRPSFSLLVETISKTLVEKADYLTVEISLDHYDSSSGHAEEV